MLITECLHWLQLFYTLILLKLLLLLIPLSILIQLIQLILLLQQLKPFKSNKTKSVTHEHTDQTCYETRNVTSGLTWGLDYLYRLIELKLKV